ISSIGDRDTEAERLANTQSIHEQVRVGIELTSNRIQDLEGEQVIERRRIKVLERERDELREAQVAQEAGIAKIESVLVQFDRCARMAEDLAKDVADPESYTVGTPISITRIKLLIDEIDRIRHLCGQIEAEAEQFWRDCQLEEAVCAILAPCLQRILDHWDPLRNPTFLQDSVFKRLVPLVTNNDGEY
ncbi:hypothetical protein EV182_008695, partial [Spiromyces aspiralis]